jgi:hypothetical protein
MTKKLTQVSMNLSSRSLKNIDELSALIGEANRTRVISSSLEIAKAILQQTNNKKHIIVRDEKGVEQEMNFIVG